MGKVLNLEKLIPDEREIVLKISGKTTTIKIPGDMSVNDALRISKAAQNVQDDPERLHEALLVLWDILKPYNPGIAGDNFIKSITIQMLAPMMNFIFQNQGGEEPEEKNVSGR